MQGIISSEIVIAYTQCKRKAFSLLCMGKKGGSPHEYICILEKQAERNKKKYINSIKLNSSETISYSLILSDIFKQKGKIIIEATLVYKDLNAYSDILTRICNNSSSKKHTYEPTLIVGTYSITKEQKLQLLFISYVLSKLQNYQPAAGTIITDGNKTHKIKLRYISDKIEPILKDLREWTHLSKPDPTPIHLNKQCPYCLFREECKAKAEESDNLSLLSRMTPKVIQKYNNKGIFTVNQLSYLFRPRKKRKKKVKSHLHYRAEVQALAIKTGKIYIQELPEFPRHQVEMFLDVEGIPDQDLYYLIGLLISNGEDQTYYSFYADYRDDVQQIWNSFIEKINEYPDAPIYHYGSYDSIAIHKLKELYGKDTSNIEERLININTFVYAKVYFPVKSNSLKELGKFVGASWTHADATGLQSMVWRYYWDENQNEEYKKKIITYNEEDCKALWLLTEELTKIIETADSKWNIDFADQPKKHTTEIGSQIHKELEQMLQCAHASYNQSKISIRQKEKIESGEKKKRGAKKGHQVFRRITPSRANTIIKVKTRRGKCPIDKSQWLKKSKVISEKIIIDLSFTKNGCRKRILKYVGNKAYCKKCGHYFLPPEIAKFNNQVFGHKFQSWVIYQRVALRMPYLAIVQLVRDLFDESISDSSISAYIRYFVRYYSSTEKMLIQRILESPFVHVDETKINIQGENHYVWVFTDGKHVVFRKTKTREATIVHEFLSNYTGILVSDFYPGYDSVKCRQQKCLSHLMRDINDDLWKEPFNEEYEFFVLEAKNLIVPILEAVLKYGLKKRHLYKFKKSVDLFYKKNIDSRIYKFEVTTKYQKRFQRYRESLFIFLEEDGIPWNNNMAERALRHLAVQRKISGTFYESLVSKYLLLLGIAQTCRFQNKPFLEFLLSQEKDIDYFKTPKPRKHTRLVVPKVKRDNINDHQQCIQ